MSKIVQVAENVNFTVVNFGKLSQLSEHIITNPESGQIIAKGKVFLKDVTKATASEISFSVLPPKTELPFFHTHIKNEESYLILSGVGKFQVDDECFDIMEGSVIRIAPAGKRSMINTSDEAMIYIVVQSKENSLEEYTMDDGNIVENTSKW